VPINPFELISLIAFYTELLPVLFYLILQKRIQDKVIRVIFWLLVVGFFIDVLNNYISSQSKSTVYIANLFTLIETQFVVYFFYKILHSPVAKKITIISALLFIVFWAVLYVKEGQDHHLESIFAIEAIGIISLSTYYFYEQLKVPDTPFVYMQPRFWVVTAYLIYTSGTFFLFLYLDSLELDLQKKYYLLNSVFLILKTILLSIGMFMTKKTEKKKF
jgi:hypothetical protein